MPERAERVETLLGGPRDARTRRLSSCSTSVKPACVCVCVVYSPRGATSRRPSLYCATAAMARSTFIFPSSFPLTSREESSPNMGVRGENAHRRAQSARGEPFLIDCHQVARWFAPIAATPGARTMAQPHNAAPNYPPSSATGGESCRGSYLHPGSLTSKALPRQDAWYATEAGSEGYIAVSLSPLKPCMRVPAPKETGDRSTPGRMLTPSLVSQSTSGPCAKPSHGRSTFFLSVCVCVDKRGRKKRCALRPFTLRANMRQSAPPPNAFPLFFR